MAIRTHSCVALTLVVVNQATEQRQNQYRSTGDSPKVNRDACAGSIECCHAPHPEASARYTLPMGMSPVKNFANIVCLSLAYDDLQCVAEGDQPALAAQRTHFANVV